MGQKLAGSEVSYGQEGVDPKVGVPEQRHLVGQLEEAQAESVLDWPVLRRCRWALWLNIVVPGAGLIGLQRLGAGLATAVGFGLTAQIAAVGLLIGPQSLGPLITVGATIGGALAWLVSQVLLLKRVGELQDTERRIGAARHIDQAREAVFAGRWAEAHAALKEASRYDDEQPDLNWLLAKVMTATGRSDLAARQWRRLRQVDRVGRYAKEVERYFANSGLKSGIDGLAEAENKRSSVGRG